MEQAAGLALHGRSSTTPAMAESRHPVALHEVVVVEEAVMPRVWLQQHRALNAVNLLTVVPGPLSASCRSPGRPCEALHRQLCALRAHQPAQKHQPVLRACAVSAGEHQPQLCSPVLLLVSACPAGMTRRGS